jgi:tripartite-type tricarboxylate transporter receptor subunit TctC
MMRLLIFLDVLKMKRMLFVRALLLAVMLPWGLSAHAQSWPTRPITLVVPFPPGGGTDVVARLLATRLGQPVVIDNKPGAATAIGAAHVAKASPDGHTLLLSGSSTYSILPALKPGLPYEPIDSFAHVAVVARAPLLLLTGAQTQVHSASELVKKAGAAPSPWMYATFGAGSGPHLAGAMLAEAAQIRLGPVPYKGSAPALTGLIAGEVPFGFDTVAAGAPLVQAGKLRALAITGNKRSPLLPDVPTYAEVGLGKASLVSWYGLVAPARTPEPVLRRLGQEVATVMADPEVRKALTQAGLEPVMLGQQAFRQLIEDEVLAFRVVAHRGQITLD